MIEGTEVLLDAEEEADVDLELEVVTETVCGIISRKMNVLQSH